MHMTCPAQCQFHLSSDGRDGCEDSDALYRFVTRVISPVHVEDGFWEEADEKSVLFCFFLFPKKGAKKKKGEKRKEEKGLIGLKVYRCRAVLGVRFKANVCFVLALLCHLDTYNLCEPSAPPCEGEEEERMIPNQLKTHADMQTQPERGQ